MEKRKHLGAFSRDIARCWASVVDAGHNAGPAGPTLDNIYIIGQCPVFTGLCLIALPSILMVSRQHEYKVDKKGLKIFILHSLNTQV